METLYYSRLQSPVGPLLIGVSQEALVALEFDRGLPQKMCGLQVRWEESEVRTRAVREQLQQYFSGQRRNFELALDLRGTEFHKRCWQQLLQIPYGETFRTPTSRGPWVVPRAFAPSDKRTITTLSPSSCPAIAFWPPASTSGDTAADFP